MHSTGERKKELRLPAVRFPGAVDSKFTTKLSFEHPSTHPAIPTYRFMDSNGVVVDKAREPGVSDEEVLKWYTNMLTGMNIPLEPAERLKGAETKGVLPGP
ncbi:MAG: hypothetical protein Q9186_006379 [Xanthomendoza sp. 1 TL-2023]